MAENQLMVLKNSISELQTAPQILEDHQNRAAKALKVADAIIDQWNAAFAEKDLDKKAELLKAADERSNKFLANCSTANKEMKDARAAITQLMEMLREMYTAEENSLDNKKGPKPIAIQNNRNQYARWAIEEDARKKKVAEQKLAKEKEAVDIKTYISKTISQKLYEYLAQRKITVSNSFNAIMLDNFKEKSDKLKMMVCSFPEPKLGEIIAYNLPNIFYHNEPEVVKLKTEEHGSYDFGVFYAKYQVEMQELKESLIDRLPSKLAELEEAKRKADKAEEDRLAEVERQRLAEEERQQELKKTKDKQAKKDLQAKQEKERQDEKDRLADLAKKEQEEKNQAEIDKKQREQDDLDKLAREANQNQLYIDNQAEVKQSAGAALALFGMAGAEAEIAGGSPEVRKEWKITVMNPAGWVELFTFWFQKEGVSLSLEKLEKMTFEQVRSFVSKAAKDSLKKKGEKIESKNLVYEEDIKSVNRKAKA